MEFGDIDIDGTPFFTVIVDGVWSTRSYGVNYDALSGAVSFVKSVNYISFLHQSKWSE